MDWGLDDEMTAEDRARLDARRDPIRRRARLRLEQSRDGLPPFTEAQFEMLVEMLVDAYEAGEMDRDQVACQEEWHETRERSLKGVVARRRKSKRQTIVEAFEAAAAASKEVSVEQLAEEHGVSRATVYRALNMKRSPQAKR